MTAPVPEHHGMQHFFGLLLMAVGGLIAVTCGLCTLVVGGLFVVSAVSVGGMLAGPSALSGLLLPLIVGGVPAAGGAYVFVVGRRMFRRGRDEPKPIELDKTFS